MSSTVSSNTAHPGKALPVPTPTTRPFWEGTRAGELRLPRCEACNREFLYPRIRCPFCSSDRLGWVRASGRAKLHSYVINHMPAPGWAQDVPYIIAVVELEEGPRMMSNLVGVAATPAALSLDMPLEVVFELRGDVVLPLFKPATAPEGQR